MVFTSPPLLLPPPPPSPPFHPTLPSSCRTSWDLSPRLYLSGGNSALNQLNQSTPVFCCLLLFFACVRACVRACVCVCVLTSLSSYLKCPPFGGWLKYINLTHLSASQRDQAGIPTSTCRTGRTAPDTSCPRRRRQPQQRQRWLWPSLSSRFCCHVWWPWWFRSWSCRPFSSVLSPYTEWTTVCLDLIKLGSGAGVVDRSVQSCRRTLSGQRSALT